MLFQFVLVSVFAVALSEPTITLANVNEKLRLLRPSFLLIEQLFDVKDNNFCLEKMFCLLETEMPHEEHNPFKYYSRFLTNTHHDFDDLAFREIESIEVQYPKLSKIIASIKLGQYANTSEVCNQRYSECTMSQSEIISEISAYSDDNILKNGFPNSVKRGLGCFWGGVACSALGGGCAVCTAMTAGFCGGACGASAVGCIVHSLSCRIG